MLVSREVHGVNRRSIRHAPSALALANSAAVTDAEPGDGSAAVSDPFPRPSTSPSGVAPRLAGGDGPPEDARGSPEMCSTSSRWPSNVRRHTSASMSHTLLKHVSCEGILQSMQQQGSAVSQSY